MQIQAHRHCSKCYLWVTGEFLIVPSPLVSVQTWRPFCNKFEDVIEDFNYGTLLRLNCEQDYTEENTIFGTSLAT